MSTADLPLKLRQLEQQLAVREQEVAALREIAEAAAELQSQDVQGAKVIEMSKKNRSLNLLLEKERQKVAKLQQALSQASQTKPASVGESKPAAAADERSQELAALKERLQQMTNRMGQMEQKVFLLEGENRKLSRALIREVGEGVPLSKVLEEGGAGSDWKGRREQIIRLQDTIKQLKEAAQAAGGGNISGSSSSSSLAKHETAHRNVIGKLNKQKEVDLQRMAAELEGAQQAAEQLRLKYTGAASRRKVLEEEVAGLKDKLAVVLSKTQNDDKLIAALRAELLATTRGQRQAGGSTGRPADASGGDGSFELPHQRCAELEEQVEQQQKVIRYLQAQLGGSKGSAAGSQQQHWEAENEQLRQQLAVLRLGAAGSGAAAALQQQVLVLQEENTQMRQQLRLQASQSGLQLTQSDRSVLEAKEAVVGEGEDVDGSVGVLQEEVEQEESEDERELDGGADEAEEHAEGS